VPQRARVAVANALSLLTEIAKQEEFDMKKILTTLSAMVIMLSFALVAAETMAKDVTFSVKFGAMLSRSISPLGDRPGHELIQTVREGTTQSSDPDWSDVPVINYGQFDLVSGSGTVAGYTIRTHKNGDQSFYRYQGKLKAATGGNLQDSTGEGTVELVGGTGKFANARGSGTWISTGNGISTVRMNIEY
jgi:hypothetical protein